ncbi:hypothetical protein SAMN04488503_0154 [Humidesulfovibrio mexicanus]|jgi:hypothetical protein|uniref:Uncharacterized protein n=1 Tax=Humidesulfovibrio mexicanus TaxID=147047 RepID=A0A239D842_9BACT|nr:hypothetical protein [Humidesulfovibrio mexicanus]SNS28449.1 hypothetical protein SAMN04488503_0154 [Humidesulfovibrio mexicanus]
MNIGDIIALRDCLTVAHHVPGRIRIRFSLALLARPEAKALLAASGDGRGVPGFRGMRLNAAARSVVIEYDPVVIPPDKLDEALTTGDRPRLAALVEEFTALAAQAAR